MNDRNRSRREFISAGAQSALATALSACVLPAAAQTRANSRDNEPHFRRIRTQFIAALAEPDATSGSNAEDWGLWELDPGPRGVRLSAYEHLRQSGGIAPAGWRFDESDWWLEEHGLIMEPPEFPLASGEYLVTGDRSAVSVLRVHAADSSGAQNWELSDGANIYDVTHLRCRSARYTSSAGANGCSPIYASQADFPVSPGAEMPPVPHCSKQDYAVLLVIGRPVVS